MSSLSATPQNRVLGAIARALRGGKDALNYPGKLPESVPFLGGMGAGDAVFGEGPELMEDMSYGSPPYRGKGMATQVDPRVIDLAAAPGVATATSAALRGARGAAAVAPRIATGAGRREFVKKAGGLAAGAAASAVAPDMLLKALRAAPSVAEKVIPMAAKEIVPAAAVSAVKSWTPELVNSGIKAATQYLVGEGMENASPKLVKHFMNKFETPEQFKNYMKVHDFESGSTFKGLDQAGFDARQAHLEAIDDFASYDDIERAVKTNNIPEEWSQKTPGGKPVTMDDLMEKMTEFFQDPNGMIDETRPDFFTETMKEFYGD